MEEYYKQTVADSLIGLNSQKQGLSHHQVQDRRAESKKYAIKEQKKQGFFAKFFIQLKELMVLVLLVSGVVSIVVGIVENSTSEIVDGAIILGIVVMNALFGVYQERKSERAIESLKQISQPETYVIRENKVVKIKTIDLVFGDVVSLSAGSVIPADLRLIESVDLKINESALTGESEAVLKSADVVYEKNVALAERCNMAFCGSFVECGVGKGVVTALGRETELGKIAQTLNETKKELTPLQKNIQFVGKILTYLILLIAGVTFVLEICANPNQILRAFLTAIAISVAAIPESLPAVITIIMSLGVGKLSKQKAIVKRLHSVETLGACDVICSDKTGTITQNKMVLKKYFAFFDKTDAEFQFLLKNMVLCNDAKLGESGYIGSATELALINFAHQHQIDKDKEEVVFPRLTEEPFNSKTKIMFSINDIYGKKICFAKGALDRILNLCNFYQTRQGVLPLNENIKEEIKKQNNNLCNDALRVIAFAYKQSGTIDSCSFIFQGLCGIEDPPRKEIFEAVKTCKKAGMRPIMITGDFKNTAIAIAKQTGIAQSEKDAISGEELDKLSDEELQAVVESKSVFARVSPEHKVKIVSALQRMGHVVAMTGDGVNDAASLKKADIGIGMGKSGTDIIKETADILITDDNFATIVVAVQEGRKIYSNIQKTIKYLFSANMAEIFALFFITLLLPGKTFLFPIQILFVNLITDSLPAIALGAERVEQSVMDEKPRPAKDTLLSHGVGISILLLGAVQTILTLCAYLMGFYIYGEAVGTTMAFYTLNFIQLFYMFTARTKESCFKSNPFKNKFFTLSIVAGFSMLAIIATTKLSGILKLTHLNGACWLFVLLVSVSIIFIGELYKIIERKILNKKLH